MHRVTPNVYAEDRYLVATVGFLVTREGVVMMDTPQCPSDAREWRAQAEKHGEIRYVVNTEHHRDHIVGNAFFPGIVVAHAGTAERFFRSLEPFEQVRKGLVQIDPQGAELLANCVPPPATCPTAPGCTSPGSAPCSRGTTSSTARPPSSTPPSPRAGWKRWKPWAGWTWSTSSPATAP